MDEYAYRFRIRAQGPPPDVGMQFLLARAIEKEHNFTGTAGDFGQLRASLASKGIACFDIVRVLQVSPESVE